MNDHPRHASVGLDQAIDQQYILDKISGVLAVMDQRLWAIESRLSLLERAKSLDVQKSNSFQS